jgi:hypothetical protein
MNDERTSAIAPNTDDQRRLICAIEALTPTLVQHFEQRERPADYYSRRRTNKPRPRIPFPSRRVLKRIRAMPIEVEGEPGSVMAPAGTKRPRVLSVNQLNALYDAIASSSGWWPWSDSRWDPLATFAKLEKYVMYLDDMPIGFGALERNSGAENVTRIVFVGIIPSMQGYRFGNYLFNFINHLAREGGTEIVVLNTAPEFDTMKGAGKPEQSAAKMYLAAKFRLVRTETIDAKKLAVDGQKLEMLNLPAYYRNHPSFTRDALVKSLCDEFECRIPYLPDKAKGR